ncbi:MAG: aldehyde ferredoxin oxidoreductase [Chloroflexi bacterium]|nr:aldehyde ferredoxin oxidoreductase [Chloroflexota bacterium]
MHIWRVNVNTQSLSKDPVPDAWDRLGGRGLIVQMLLDEVPPDCDPLGPDNNLIFAPGLLVGHKLSSCDRISIGAKSPLTKGVKESNAGGRTGLHLTYLGIKALIIEGQPAKHGWWALHLSEKGSRFEPADNLVGLGVYAAAALLNERYGEKVAIALIGPGGEMLMQAAGIQNTDNENTPSRISARGGLGAVMGSKGIKAIVIDAQGGEKPPISDQKRFREAQKAYNAALMGHPQTQVYAEYGTAGMTKISNAFGGLPTRNFSSGQFEGSENISGENMRELLLKRGGASKTTHACMAGCTIRCSNVFGSDDGDSIVSPLEYETIGLMGSNLGIDDLDAIARLNWELNDLGIDSIEIGAALGVAAEAGMMEFGDGERALELIAEIRSGTSLGKVLGDGVVSTGNELGIERVPAVKGQAMSAYEPRAIKGTGVTYATSPQGADHTAGLTIRAKIDHIDPQGQVELSRNYQINMAGYDSLGACLFSGFGFAAAPHTIPDLLNARYGWDVPEDILQQLGRETLKLEREFNRQAGFTKVDDRLPEWMSREPLPPHNTVFDIPEEELDGLFDW